MPPQKSIYKNNYRYIFFILGLFAILGLFIRLFPSQTLDLNFSRTIQSVRFFPFSEIMYIVSSIGNTPIIEILIGLVFVALYYFGRKIEALISVLLPLTAFGLGSLLKIFIGRPRPDTSLINVSQQFQDKSFPSLHVLIFTAFFGYLYYYSHKNIHQKSLRYFLSFIFLFLIFSISLSRIYLGAHWLTDTLGSYLLGIMLLFTFITLEEKIKIGK